jgi:hypothetical protein
MFRLLTCMLVFGAGLALAQHPLSLPKVYLTQDGARAVTAVVKAKTDDRCLLMLTGPFGELDGLVLEARCDREDAQTTYLSMIRGRETKLFRTPGDGTGTLGSSAGKLQYSEPETNKLDLAALWAKHQAQVTSGQLAALSGFDRAAEVASQAKDLADAAEPLNRACGTKLVFTLDWSNAPDDIFKATQPQASCLKIIRSIQEMCEQWKVARTTIAQSLTEVRCTYGEDKPTFTLAGTIVTMTSAEWTVSLPGDFERWIKEAL